MKKIYVMLAFAFVFISCNCQKPAAQQDASAKATASEQAGLPKLEYTANTRGFFQKITIENQTVKVAVNRDMPDKGESVKISDADVKELMAAYRTIKVEQLPTLKDPTQQRFYDGAAIANLKVTVNGKEYQTTDFDHGFPPVEIEKLVNKIASFGTR